jgi:hypothetical protein
MLSPDKTGMLLAFLGSLPGHMASRLARAVEVDRLMDGTALPHEDILAGLRQTLRQGAYDRTRSPLRLFCVPFEDLLVNAPGKAKLKGVIARASVVPVWVWVSRTLIAAESTRYAAEVRSLALAGKAEDAEMRAAAFWPLAAEALKAALADEKAARQQLGGDMAVADAREMALMLAAGPAITKLQALLIPPAPALRDNLLWDVRAIYDEIAQTLPDAAPYVAVVAMNRLAKPCEALRLPQMVSRHSDDTLISQTDMGLIGEILMARLQGLGTAIAAQRHPAFDDRALLEDVRGFAELSSAFVKEIEMRRDGEWGQRLLKERGEVGKAMDALMERAPREFAAALPLQKGSGPRTADFGRAVAAEKQELALRYARLVAGSRNFAAAASFAARQKDCAEEISAYLRRYNEDLVKALRGPQREVALSQFALCAELTALLFSGEEAQLLHRRARAAQQAA